MCQQKWAYLEYLFMFWDSLLDQSCTYLSELTRSTYSIAVESQDKIREYKDPVTLEMCHYLLEIYLK